jgi:catechol 2,3-dioxygenase-like lactoylglutathione lyase family enzyme
MAVPAHLSVVTLGVADLQRSVSFYEALGWQRSSASEGEIAFFSVGGTNLALFGRAALAADATVSAEGGGFRGVSLAINLGSTASVDRVYGEFLGAGATPVKSPVATEWGGYSGYAADPDGHLWEIAHNPYSPEWAAPGSE